MIWSRQGGLFNLGSFSFRTFFVVFTLYSTLSFSSEPPPSFEVMFHNVGQGNCTVVKSPTKQVLIVDAGSSNTTGVLDMPKEGKYDALANKIFNSIRSDIESSRWIWVVVSHPDKDHLNLVKMIVKQAEPLCEVCILFGGQRNIYQKEDSKTLVDFLEEEKSKGKVKYFFGGEQYVLGPDRASYTLRESAPPLFSEWKGKIEFLAVDSVVTRRVSATRSTQSKKEREIGNYLSSYSELYGRLTG